MRIGLIGFILAFAVSASAQTTESADSKAEIHKNKAQVYINEKNWAQASEQARLATEAKPQDPDAWLILGTVEARLEKNAEALAAFKKYLELKPPEKKAALVRQRVAELEILAEKDAKIKADAEAAELKRKTDKYGIGGSGVIIGISPTFNIKAGSDADLGSSISKSFDFGFRFGKHDIGFRNGTGDVASAQSYDESTEVTTAVANGTHSLSEIYYRFYIAANTPAQMDRGLHILVPIHIGGFINTVKFDKSYWNMGMDLGSGIQFRFFTQSTFSFDLSAIYYVSTTATAIQNNDAEIITLKNNKGKEIRGNLSGTEVRLGVSLLF